MAKINRTRFAMTAGALGFGALVALLLLKRQTVAAEPSAEATTFARPPAPAPVVAVTPAIPAAPPPPPSVNLADVAELCVDLGRVGSVHSAADHQRRDAGRVWRDCRPSGDVVTLYRRALGRGQPGPPRSGYGVGGQNDCGPARRPGRACRDLGAASSRRPRVILRQTPRAKKRTAEPPSAKDNETCERCLALGVPVRHAS
jgi:hypothetical protein